MIFKKIFCFFFVLFSLGFSGVSLGNYSLDTIVNTYDTRTHTQTRMTLGDLLDQEDCEENFQIQISRDSSSFSDFWVMSSSRAEHVKMLSIETSDGQKLLLTPNHNVLTKRGFLVAARIKQGDTLVLGSGQETDVTALKSVEQSGYASIIPKDLFENNHQILVYKSKKPKDDDTLLGSPASNSKDPITYKFLEKTRSIWQNRGNISHARSWLHISERKLRPIRKGLGALKEKFLSIFRKKTP